MQTEKTINIGEIFMPSTYTEIIAAFDEHLQRSGRSFYNEFYIGVTNDAARRLFQEHNVDKEHSWWIYRTAENSEIAREVEKYYLDLGMRGGPGGGDDSARMVYCYVVTPTTTE